MTALVAAWKPPASFKVLSKEELMARRNKEMEAVEAEEEAAPMAMAMPMAMSTGGAESAEEETLEETPEDTWGIPTNARPMPHRSSSYNAFVTCQSQLSPRSHPNPGAVFAPAGK